MRLLARFNHRLAWLRIIIHHAGLSISVAGLILILLVPPALPAWPKPLPVIPLPGIALFWAVALLLANHALNLRKGLFRRIGIVTFRRSIAIAFGTLFTCLFVFLIVGPAQLLGRLAYGLGRCPNAEIVFRKLEIALRHHGIARRLRVASELHVFFGNGLSRAANLHVWPVAFINPVQGVSAAIILVASAATWPAVIATAIAVLVVVIVLALTRPVSVIKIQVITPANMPP
jgi:hypothetical protein